MHGAAPTAEHHPGHTPDVHGAEAEAPSMGLATVPVSLHMSGPPGSDLPCLEASRQPRDRGSFPYTPPVTRAETHLREGPGLTPVLRIKAALQIALGKVHI